MKDYIYVYDKDNIKKKMEVVCTFSLPNYDYNYIIYKTLDNSHNYVARYSGNDFLNLDNSLTEEEIKLATEIFERIK